MDMIGKVRRMKLRDQLSDGEICRRTGLARNTVKKWLKAPGDITPKYERKKAQGKLTPFEPVLDQALRTDAHRAKRRLPCQVDSLKLETFRSNTLGRNAAGGTSPRDSCGRYSL